MSDYTAEYVMVAVNPKELQDINLTKEFGELRSDEEVEAYRVRFVGERGLGAGGQTGELLYLPQRGRAAVAWAGEAVWTDASSAEEAMERYLDHTILEDNEPEVI